MNELLPQKKSAFEDYATELIGDIGVLNHNVKQLKADLPSMLQQIAAGASEVARIQTATKKTGWVVAGLLAGLAIFGMGVSYGAIYSTWSIPAWIDRNGLLSVLSAALLKAPVGGVGCIVIALALILLQRNIIDSLAENEEDTKVTKILVYFFAAVFAATGSWLSFLVMF